MSHRVIFITLFAGLIISGCASLSKEECATANWDAIGYGDGSRGEPAGHFNRYQKACAEHGYSSDFNRYRSGHQRGLEEVFCKPRSAYQLGLRGGSYQNVCPAYLEAEFLGAYHYGRDIFEQQRVYNDLARQRTQLNNDLAALDERIGHLQHEISDGNHTGDTHSRDQQDDRNRVQAAYHEIENRQPVSARRDALQNHLRAELAAQQRLVEQAIKLQTSSRKVMPARDKQLIRTLANDATEKGRLDSAIQWINRNAKAARTRAQQVAILQKQLHQVSDKLDRDRQTLRQHDLTDLIAQAEFAGALKQHGDVLAQARDQYSLDLLIDIHFAAELANLESRYRIAQEHATHDKNNQQQLYRKLREARHQRRDALRELDVLLQEMDELANTINHMKSTSRYQ